MGSRPRRTRSSLGPGVTGDISRRSLAGERQPHLRIRERWSREQTPDCGKRRRRNGREPAPAFARRSVRRARRWFRRDEIRRIARGHRRFPLIYRKRGREPACRGQFPILPRPGSKWCHRRLTRKAAFRSVVVMKILVTGSTGLVGKALVAALAKDGHSVCRLVRPETNVRDEAGGFNVAWNPATGELGGAAVGADAVVNLAGASIAEGRWTEKRKAELRSSRVDVTRVLIEALGKMNVKPTVLISASAIGYYGNRGDEMLDEGSAAGEGFLAGIA